MTTATRHWESIPQLSEPSAKLLAIIDAATKSFHLRGFAGTSMQDIADAVGLQKGSLYHYIGSKDDLLYAVVKEHHAAVFANVERSRGEICDQLTRVRSFIEWHARYNALNATRASVFHNEFRYLTDDRLATIINARDEYEGVLRALIDDARSAGALRSDTDPRLGAFLILGVLNSLQRWYRPDGPISPDELATRVAETLLHGLALSEDR